MIAEQFSIFGNYREALTEIGNLSRQAHSQLSLLGSVAGAVGLSFSIMGLAKMSDDYSLLNARMKTFINTNEELSDAQSKLKALAKETRGSYESLAGTFTKLGMQTKGVFGNNDEIIQFTGNLQKLFTVGGADDTTIQSTMYNLTQSLASGKLLGNDYRILKQNAPQMIALLRELKGVTQSELDDMVSAGKITAQDIKEAMTGDSFKEIEKQFETMPVTFSQSMTLLGDAIKTKIEPALMSLAQIATVIANNIDIIIPALEGVIAMLGAMALRMALLKFSTSSLAVDLKLCFLNLPGVIMGSTGALTGFRIGLEGVKTALASTGIGLIPIAIGVAVTALSILISKLGGLKATFLIVKDAVISGFQVMCEKIGWLLDILLAPILLIINGVKLLKSAITGHEFKNFSFSDIKFDDEAHKKRLDEIKQEQEKNGVNAIGGLGEFTLNDVSSTASDKLTNSINLADENIKYISDLAERKYMVAVNLQAPAPNISINQNVNGDGASNASDMERILSKTLQENMNLSNTFVGNNV